MNRKRSKKELQNLRKLVAIAYERELTAAAENLLQQFQSWKNSEIDVFELGGRIHEFHNGISRTLYNHDSVIDPAFGVALALSRDILSREEVGEEVFLSVEGIVTTLR